MNVVDVELRGYEGYWQELWINGSKVDEFHDFDKFKLVEYINGALAQYDVRIDLDEIEENVEGIYG